MASASALNSPALQILRAVLARPLTSLRLLSSEATYRIMPTAGAKEISVLRHIYAHTNLSKIRRNPSALADAIDAYAASGGPLMTIGPAKRGSIINILKQSSPGPKTFVEFGAYVGYSAVALAGALRELNRGHKARYISLEMNALNAAITSSFAELAGLKNVVEVEVGPAAETLARLVREGGLKKGEVDFMLVDHWKDVYLSDLQVCERLGLLKRGAVIVADNIKFPGAPDYLEYVTKGVAEQSNEGLKYETHTEDFETSWGPVDQLAISKVV